MKNNKLFTLAFLSGILTMTSCDDIVDCGCDCNKPNITSWEVLDASKLKNEDGTAYSGTAIIAYGSNLSDIISITFKDKAAELQPAFMSDNQIVFQVPEGIAPENGQKEFIAHITTKSCPTGFDTDKLIAAVAPPCPAMCDNEFAVKTLKVKGNSFFKPMKALFWDGEDYTIEASTENGMIDIKNQNEATIKIPSGVKDGGHIVFKTDAGEKITDFIFRDTRNLLITNEEDDGLEIYNGKKPDTELTNKEELVNTIFKSDNTNGKFAIFNRDGNDFVGLTYEPYDSNANPDDKTPKYSTPFGVFTKDILSGKTNPNDYTIKFEVFVSDKNPMEGDCLVLGVYDGVTGDYANETRDYCACWQPSIASFEKDDDGVWIEASIKCDKWSCPDWMTVSVPVKEILYNFKEGSYKTAPQNGRKIMDGSAKVYKYFGDDENGYPFFTKKTNYSELFGETGTEEPADLDDPSATALALVQGSYDQPIFDKKGRHPYIAVDNVRIVPNDNNNGGVWELTQWGTPTRDFYTKPITSCK